MRTPSKPRKTDRGERSGDPKNKAAASRPYLPWLLLSLCLGLFLLLLYPSLSIRRYSYAPGDVVEHDIKAPQDFFIEDEAASRELQRKAAEAVLTVYDHDTTLMVNLVQRVETAFKEMRQRIPSTDEVVDLGFDASADTQTPYPDPAGETVGDHKNAFESVLGLTISEGAFDLLRQAAFSHELQSDIVRILTEIMGNGIVANKELLLREAEKGITLRELPSQKERLVKNLRPYYGPDQAKTMVRVVGQPLLVNQAYARIGLVVDLVQRLLQPNISLNRHETEARKQLAIVQTKPILYKIKAGEMLLREGERVTAEQIIKLKALAEQARTEKLLSRVAGGGLLLICLLLTAYYVGLQHTPAVGGEHDRNLLFCAFVLVVLLLVIKFAGILTEAWTDNALFSIPAASLVYGIPLTCGAMTVCLFLGPALAHTFGLVVAVCSAIMLQNRFELFIYFWLSSVIAAYWTQSCRERQLIIQAGLKIGLVNAILATAIDLYFGEITGYQLLWNVVFAFMGGAFAGIITIGVAPVIEMLFHYTTDITLLERANLDRPLLRRLMIEAPGTYHHSVIVGSLVEAAATEIGANPLLAKVCGYYHDIGKIKKPLYFIENQTNGRNRHDKLAPSMSALILSSHVKEGVEIARQHKLGTAIIDAIKQHHGTSLISYFFEKAKQLRGEENVNVSDFRYPGPKPQTKEAGLVMLADVVEAASRTLENPTPARIQGLVQNLINKIFSDGQLDDCELTLKDLHRIARSFYKILNGIHHHRIEYAEVQSLAQGKSGEAKHGDSDRQSSKKTARSAGKRPDEGRGHLKRLGLS
ncbi:MAG: HDIG domain-containing protein [Desulfosarcinaceae bacterium]|nr:HDIG domain-containing protein [Desulfosarcinaceae bacterium]